MIEKYVVGTCVKLKSGGPDMTVKVYSAYESAYNCQWFAGKKSESSYFPHDSLVEVKTEE